MKHFIKNTTEKVQAVPGYPAFAPGEIREVTQTDAQILEANPYLTADPTEGAETFGTDESVKEEKPTGTKRKNSI